MLKTIFQFVATPLLLTASLGAQTLPEALGLYFGDWRTAPIHREYGGLSAQDIFVTGDALKPTAKAAVLRYVTAYRHATLAAHASTAPIRLRNRQEIYFIVGGKGAAVAGPQTAVMSPNTALLMPAELEFTLKNTGDMPLEMYIIQEPTPAGFHPNTSIVTRNENVTPFSTIDRQWSLMTKPIFVASDGLATLDQVSTISLDPLTISRPQVTPSTGAEAVWTALEGTSLAFVSNQVIPQAPGISFFEIPDGKTPHSVVNNSRTSRVRLLYFSARAH